MAWINLFVLLCMVSKDIFALVTRPYQFSSFVRLFPQGGELTDCGGVLIDKEYIITSASCLKDSYCQTYTVVAGSWNVSQPKDEQWRHLVSIATHPNLEVGTPKARWIRNDVAIAKLDRPMDLNDKVGTAPLPTKIVDQGRFVLVESSLLDGLVHHLELPAMNESDCQVEGMRQFDTPVENFMVCLYDKKSQIKNSCHGYGSPLFQVESGVPKLVGIGSFQVGFDCQKMNRVNVYHELYYYLDWIKTFMKANR